MACRSRNIVIGEYHTTVHEHNSTESLLQIVNQKRQKNIKDSSKASEVFHRSQYNYSTETGGLEEQQNSLSPS